MLMISCTVTRAVNLEMMSSGEAHSCLLALERFVAVYGRPEKINSDSGRNLMKVKKEVEQTMEMVGGNKTSTMGRYPGSDLEQQPSVFTELGRTL